MLTFHVVTLFPDLIDQYCSVSIVARGIKAGKLAVKTVNPRDFCQDKYKKVDDTPYGGGAGMVLLPETYFAAVESIADYKQMPVLLMCPQGQPFKQENAKEFSESKDIVLLCGHYEGYDERIRSLATHEFSIGDFVLTGGELAALAVLDAVGRLVPGVVGKALSIANESFNDGLLEGPQYTKPAVFRDMSVPDVLLSGDHKKISKWRREQSLLRTYERRPDLLASAELTADDRKFLKSIDKTIK